MNVAMLILFTVGFLLLMRSEARRRITETELYGVE